MLDNFFGWSTLHWQRMSRHPFSGYASVCQQVETLQCLSINDTVIVRGKNQIRNKQESNLACDRIPDTDVMINAICRHGSRHTQICAEV